MKSIDRLSWKEKPPENGSFFVFFIHLLIAKAGFHHHIMTLHIFEFDGST